MPDDLGMRIGEALEGERELFALCPEVVKVGAVDAREEVTGSPCRSNDNHGVGVAHIKLALDPPRDVEEGRGDVCLETERCTTKTHQDTIVVAVLRSAENVEDEAFAPISKKNHWVGQGKVGFTKIECRPALGDGKGLEHEFNFLLLILIGSSGGNSLRRKNTNLIRWNTIGDRHLFCFFCRFCHKLQKRLLSTSQPAHEETKEVN